MSVKAEDNIMLESQKPIFDIAADTDQYFWHTSTGADTGAHITEIPQEDFLDDPANGGYNLLARSNGLAIRDGLTELAKFASAGVQIGADNTVHGIFTASALDFYDPTARLLRLSGTREDIYQRAYLVANLSTSTSTSVPSSAVRLKSSSGDTTSQLLLLADEEIHPQYNHGEIRIQGNYAGTFQDTEYTEALDSWLFVGSSYGSRGWEIQSTIEYEDNKGNFAENEAFISGTPGTDASGVGDLDLGLGTDRVYTAIRLSLLGAGVKGQIYFETARLYSEVALTVVSDRNLKDHKSYLKEDAVDFIRSLKPARYVKDGEEHLGFYAQDVEQANKWDAQLTPTFNGYKALTYTELIAPLVAYCQSLEERLNKMGA